MWEILKASGINPGRRRTGPTWPQFLRSQAEAILACDFFTAGLLDGTQAYVLAVIEHATRRIRILGVTLHPTGQWTAQQARNLLMDLGEQAHRVKFMIRFRGSNFTGAFDAVLADAGIRTVLCSIQTRRMNAIAERWTELLDRTLVWNQAHLRRIPGQYGTPPQSAPASPFPERRRAAEATTRACRSRPVLHPKTRSSRWPDQRISPGRMTWSRFSAPTALTSAKPSPRSRKEHPGPWNPGHPAHQLGCRYPRNPETRPANGRPTSPVQGQPRRESLRLSRLPDLSSCGQSCRTTCRICICGWLEAYWQWYAFSWGCGSCCERSG